MPVQTHQIDSLTLNGHRLIAKMQFEADRFVTELYLGSQTSTNLILRSEEGSSLDIWSASGPIQELLPHQDGDKQCLAGVGRAGKSHWSTVLSTSTDEQSAETPYIDFDFACRAKERPEFLGSTYRLNTDAVTLDLAENSGSESGSVTFRIRDQCIRCLASRGTVGQDITTGRIVISPESLAGELPQTVRWQYQFQLV